MNNFKDRLNHFFFLSDEESAQEIELVKEPTPLAVSEFAPSMGKKEITNVVMEDKTRRKSGGENVVAINQKQAIQKPQITIIEPRLYSEVQEVADYVLSNQTVIVNFRRMDHEQASKMIDFLMGVTYAIKGDIQRLDEEIFICTPQSVTVNGSDLTEFTDSLL